MTTLILIGIGAALMYFFDPDSGQRRRALLLDKWTTAMKKREELISKLQAKSGYTKEKPEKQADD